MSESLLGHFNPSFPTYKDHRRIVSSPQLGIMPSVAMWDAHFSGPVSLESRDPGWLALLTGSKWGGAAAHPSSPLCHQTLACHRQSPQPGESTEYPSHGLHPESTFPPFVGWARVDAKPRATACHGNRGGRWQWGLRRSEKCLGSS